MSEKERVEERERCAAICDSVVKAIPVGLGAAHGPEGQQIMIETAQWIADEIRARSGKH